VQQGQGRIAHLGQKHTFPLCFDGWKQLILYFNYLFLSSNLLDGSTLEIKSFNWGKMLAL